MPPSRTGELNRQRQQRSKIKHSLLVTARVLLTPQGQQQRRHLGQDGLGAVNFDVAGRTERDPRLEERLARNAVVHHDGAFIRVPRLCKHGSSARRAREPPPASHRSTGYRAGAAHSRSHNGRWPGSSPGHIGSTGIVVDCPSFSSQRANSRCGMRR